MEEIDDEYVKNYIINYKKNTGKRPIFKYYDNYVKTYILNRYSDSLSYQESIYRLLNNIENKPTCKYCNKSLIFTGRGKRQGFGKYCSHYCEAKDISQFKQVDKIKSIIFNKYGVDNVFKLKEVKDKSKQTKLEKYGNENYNNHEKFIQTCLDKYGVSCPAKDKTIREKQIKTSFEKYGGYWNKEKVSETIKEKYGVDWYVLTDDLKNKACSEDARLKQYETKRNNGTFNTSQPEEDCYKLLKSVYNDVIRQHRDERYPFNCDFYIPSLDLFIEFNGSQYHHQRPYLETEEDLKEANELLEKDKKLCEERGCDHTQYKNIWHCWTIRDPKKRQIAKENKLNFIEFWNLKEVKDWLNYKD